MAKKKLTSVIGVDIGSKTTKIVELRQSGREYSISALNVAPTPEGLVDHTGIYDTDTLGPFLKQICANAGATVNQIVFSIAGQASILVRTLEVPRMTGNELKDHMNWEISRNIPFAESTIVSDFKALNTGDPNSSNMDVVMAISPQSAIDTLMGIAKKAGKQVHAIDVEPLSIARVLKCCYDDVLGQETVCVIDVGAKSTAINMYRDGLLLMPRQVPVGGDAFTTAIANTMNVAGDEAERLKLSSKGIPEDAGGAGFAAFTADTTAGFAPYNPFAEDFAVDTPAANPFAEPDLSATPSSEPDYGMPPAYSEPAPEPDYGMPPAYSEPTAADADMPPAYQSPFEEAPAVPPADSFEPPQYDEPSVMPVPAPAAQVDPVYNAMAVEIDEFIAEVRRSVDYFRSRGGDVHRVLVCGGGANLSGLTDLISRSLGIQASALDPMRGMMISAKKIEFGDLEAHRGEFAVAVGNALHIAFD